MTKARSVRQNVEETFRNIVVSRRLSRILVALQREWPIRPRAVELKDELQSRIKHLSRFSTRPEPGRRTMPPGSPRLRSIAHVDEVIDLSSDVTFDLVALAAIQT